MESEKTSRGEEFPALGSARTVKQICFLLRANVEYPVLEIVKSKVEKNNNAGVNNTNMFSVILRVS